VGDAISDIEKRHHVVIDEKEPLNMQIPASWLMPKHLSKKKKAIDSWVASQIIEAYDKMNNPNRVFAIFFAYRNRLSDERYWEFLKLAWIVAGKKENYAAFAILMQSSKPCRHFMMTVQEHEAFGAMPDPLTLYRASYGPGDLGLSWSSNEAWVREYAEKKGCEVISKVAFKKDILCFIERRGEEEFVIIPDELKINRKKFNRKIELRNQK
jgi:hypothetical protein